MRVDFFNTNPDSSFVSIAILTVLPMKIILILLTYGKPIEVTTERHA
jgi:hypothetical protein